MRKIIKKVTENRKIIVLLVLLAFAGTLWKMYPHILVPRMFPSDEYINIGYVMWLVENSGNSLDAFHNPHLGYFLVYFVHIFTRLNVYQIVFTINPIISGLTVIPFFFFSKKILKNTNQALLASVFFTFSETVFYRTCHYSSNEALGIFLMFTYLTIYLYAKSLRQKLLSIPILILTPFAHVLPFVFASTFTVLDMFIKKRKIVSILLLVSAVILIFNPIVPPHRFIVSEIPENTSSFLLEKLFLYNLSDIIGSTLFFLGLFGMLFLSIFSYKKSTKIEKLVFLGTIISIPLSLFLYNVRLIGPTRILIYISIPLFTMTARLLEKKKIVALVVVLLMISSPLIGGTERFIWLSNSITQEEINAVNFLITNKTIVSSSGSYDTPPYWFSDTVIRQYISMNVGGETYYSNKSWFFKHVIVSERMEEQAFFLSLQENNRTLEIRKPVPDVWATNQSGWKDRYLENGVNLYGWRLIYNVEGVKVYEAIYEWIK